METPSPLPQELEAVSTAVVDSAFKVYQSLGPGLLESVYETCLCIEFDQRGIVYEKQVPVPIVYQGVSAGIGLRLDLLVEKSLIVEIKVLDQLLPVHHSQLLSYLRLTNLRLGLLINFNVALFKQGVKRIIRRFGITPLPLLVFLRAPLCSSCLRVVLCGVATS